MTDPPREPGPEPPKRSLISSEEIQSITYANKYMRFRFREPDGRIVTVICRKAVRTVDGEQKTYFPPIWDGDIRISGYYLAYEIAPARILKAPEWHLYVAVESFNAAGKHLGHANIPAMDLKQTQAKATWMDKLSVTFSGRASNIKEVIGILAENAMREPKLIIQGQGPVWLSDGSPISNGLLDHKLVFISQSAIFDNAGNKREITPDLEVISASHRYYDLTPAAHIKDAQIREGIELFRLAFAECPRYPQIPAAIIGQLMSGFAAAIDPRMFSAILQSGIRGSGKTRYAQRWDSIQSRTARGDLREIMPVLNLGDKTGTRVGGPLRVTEFGGFVITLDDVLKDGDSPLAVSVASDKISDMVRSYESGGGAMGGVDHGRNKVVSRERPALHSSVRIMSEIPITGLSTLERLIVLPHFTEKWGRGNEINVEISSRLTEPGNRELMHRAWSAYVQWAFQRMGAELTESHEKAQAEISGWDVDARTGERYAAVVTGLLMFSRFCAEHGADIGEEITAGLAALRDNAREQARANIPQCEQFARDMRATIINQRVCWVGLPNQNPDDTEAGAYSNPWVTDNLGPGDDGIDVLRTIRPEGLRIQDMGLMLERGNAVPIPGTKRFGYILPPRMDKGGRAGNPLTKGWMLALTKERFTELVKFVAKESGRNYDPASVMESLKSEHRGDVTRISWPDQKWAHIIDAVWALSPNEDEE